MSLKHNFHLNPVETFCKIGEKRPFGLILAVFGAKRGPKIWPTGAIFYTHMEVYTICLLITFHGLTFKKFRVSGQKSLFFVIKNPFKKLKTKNQNSNSTGFWAILCIFKLNIRKIGWKMTEPIRFEKKLTNGWQTARHRKSSTNYISSGAKKAEWMDRWVGWYYIPSLNLKAQMEKFNQLQES